MRVISCRCAVRCTVAFSARLDPDECILKLITGISRGADTETSADDVAPVTPGILLRGLNTIAGCLDVRSVLEGVMMLLTSICDEMSRKARRLEERSDGIDIELFIAV